MAAVCIPLRAGWSAGASGSVQAGPSEAKHHAGNLDLHSGAGVQSLCLTLPCLPSDFEVRVKRANVPDLPDTVSCSGHLLGINKINLTKENTTKKRERRKGIPQTFGCEIKSEWATGFSGAYVLFARTKTKEKEWPPQSSKAQVGWGTGWGEVKQGTLGEEMEVRSNGYTETQMHV